MKKITLMAGLAALSAAPFAQAAPLVDVYAGGYAWSPDTSGSIASGSNDIDMEDDLGFDDSDQTVLYVGLEHAVPVLPNVRLRYMDLSDDASNTLVDPITFNGQTFAGNVNSDYDMEMLDGTFYWSPLDNVVKLDLGLTVRQMDADFTIRSQTVGNVASESASETFPLAHGAVRANLPLTGVYVGGEINAIEYDGSGMRDFDAHIGWQSDFLLGVKAGYSRLEVELDDVSGLDSDLEIGGPYLAATFRF
ncbi:TIGR04219 family outer membrane beta-barrel protein [Alloalcanivorax venustensis]|uniref:TIGR04219 family outer membrane beta-barrel protein n=1 Tax=Alloalcanivorax venustensis TaxID=172371 RepID=UPI003C59111A|tara:strand:+ start:1351 stop:2097 length:747 start_codon:yes stop_codon:yes gene_type:complete